MKKLYILILLLIPFLASAQIDTVHYVQKSNTMRTDTLATNLLTLNQTTHTAEPMSGTTLKAYFQLGLLKSDVAIAQLSKTANYTVLLADFGLAKVLYLSVDCTSGNLTETMPTASSFTGYTIFVTKTDATANTVTISGASSDNIIDTQKWSKQLVSNGTTWINN